MSQAAHTSLWTLAENRSQTHTLFICRYWMMPELLLKASPVVRQLNRHLDEGVWTQLKLFDKLFSKALEVKTFDVQIVDETKGRI